MQAGGARITGMEERAGRTRERPMRRRPPRRRRAAGRASGRRGHAMNYDPLLAPGRASDAADGSMVGKMRLVLATSALLTVFIDPSSLGKLSTFTSIVFSGYLCHSMVLYVLSNRERPLRTGKLIHWLDVLWYGLIVFFTGGANSVFFLFFFFAILSASFRWGFVEGARMTLASAALFGTTILGTETDAELSRLLLRTTFLLALGHMIAYWGGSEVEQRRRLDLLHNVSRLSNPRFGVDHTIASLLTQIRLFFHASNATLLTWDTDAPLPLLRADMEGAPGGALNARPITAEAAAPLMAFGQDQLILFRRPLWHRLRWSGTACALSQHASQWDKLRSDRAEVLADMLDARAFISAPVRLRKGMARIYLVSSHTGLGRADALFLSQVMAQIFPLIESIELLDRIASSAAVRERQKIANDLHDSTIQPYIGLKHGLAAVRRKATPDNPLVADLDRLMSMTELVVGQLRSYAGQFKNPQGQHEPEMLAALRQQAFQVNQFYGIDIALVVDGDLDMSDRMAAEVFQVVSEGMNNICKHTLAKRGTVRLRSADRVCHIEIENECLPGQFASFMPVSITERASALGGSAQVTRGRQGGAAVHISLPI
jgi:signal transduction histidine kinase